jgi:signal transduction histidine kinase
LDEDRVGVNETLLTGDHEAMAAPRHHRAVGAATSSRSRGTALSRLLLVAVVYGGFSVAVVAKVSVQPVTYDATSTLTAIVDLAAGLGLIVAGGVQWLNHKRGSIGPLATLIGVAWLSADWIAWTDGSPVVRSTAMVTAPFVLPLALHLISVYQTGRGIGRRARPFVAAGYIGAAAVSIGWALFRDPFRDRYCWNNCTVNTFLVHADRNLSGFLSTLWIRFSLGGGLVLAAISIFRLSRASHVARKSLVPVLGPLVLVGLSQAIYTSLLISDPAESPRRRVFQWLFVARAVPLVGLAAGLLWTVLRELRTRRSVARLADEFGAASPPGTLATALARSLGDDQLEVAYWLPVPHVYVDASGRRVEPRPGPTQTVTPIERNGESIALITHDRALLARHDLEREIGAASRLAVDNERLAAQALAQLADLRASRTRIVEAADSTRRQLEHNLHDGAQQRLLTLSYELRLAEAEARTGGDTPLADVLAIATDRVSTALVELRDLAHGIFPVILAEAGLGPALATFADTAPLAVEFVDLPDERFPDDIEIATYITVTAGVQDANRQSASRVVARFERIPNELLVVLTNDGNGHSPDELIHVGDRVGALGGRFEINGTCVRAAIPCA